MVGGLAERFDSGADSVTHTRSEESRKGNGQYCELELRVRQALIGRLPEPRNRRTPIALDTLPDRVRHPERILRQRVALASRSTHPFDGLLLVLLDTPPARVVHAHGKFCGWESLVGGLSIPPVSLLVVWQHAVAVLERASEAKLRERVTPFGGVADPFDDVGRVRWAVRGVDVGRDNRRIRPRDRSDFAPIETRLRSTDTAVQAQSEGRNDRTRAEYSSHATLTTLGPAWPSRSPTPKRCLGADSCGSGSVPARRRPKSTKSEAFTACPSGSYGVLGRALSCFLCSSCFCFVTCCCLAFSLSFLPPLSPMPAPVQSI